MSAPVRPCSGTDQSTTRRATGDLGVPALGSPTAAHSGTTDGPPAALVTGNGMRIVGPAAAVATLVERAEVPKPGMPPADEVLYAAQFEVAARLGRDAMGAVLDVLHGAIVRDRPELPRLSWTAPLALEIGPFAGVRWTPASHGDASRAALLWRYPHPTVAGVAVSCLIDLFRSGSVGTLRVQVAAPGGARTLRSPTAQMAARPPFLAALTQRVHLKMQGVSTAPVVLEPGDVEGFVADVLLADARGYPVLICSPSEDGRYPVEPMTIARELLGVAQVAILASPAASFALSDALGSRRLGAYLGAARFYFPHFSCASSQHSRLLLSEVMADEAERHAAFQHVARRQAEGVSGRLTVAAGAVGGATVDPSGPPTPSSQGAGPATAATGQPTAAAPLVGEAGRAARTPVAPPGGRAAASPPPPIPPAGIAASPLVVASVVMLDDFDVIEDAAGGGADAPLSVTSPLVAAEPAGGTAGGLQSRAAGDRATPRGRRAARDATRDAHSDTADTARRLVQLHMTNVALAATLRSHERRIETLETSLAAALTALRTAGLLAAALGPQNALVDPSRQTVAAVVNDLASDVADAVLLLDSARASAAASPYEHPERVVAALHALADVARRRRDGVLGTGLRDAFRDLGFEYAGGIADSTSARLRQQYDFAMPDGTAVRCEEHLILGRSYDPAHCLRIYFASRVPGQCGFVVGHIGRHLDVMTSS